MEWKENNNGINTNYVLDCGDFIILFNPKPGGGIPGFEADGGGAETALVIRRERATRYLILNGDWREDYERLVPDLDACLEFYRAKRPEHGSSWTIEEESK